MMITNPNGSGLNKLKDLPIETGIRMEERNRLTLDKRYGVN